MAAYKDNESQVNPRGTIVPLFHNPVGMELKENVMSKMAPEFLNFTCLLTASTELVNIGRRLHWGRRGGVRNSVMYMLSFRYL